MKKKFIALACLTICTTVFSQSVEEVDRQRWIAEEQLRQYDFLKNFRTQDYICETKNAVIMKYEINSKKWVQETNKYQIGKKELYKIIKSDDMTSPISLCGVNDKPISHVSNLNKYFCIINTHSGERYKTHYKCLLDIYQDTEKNLIHTLVCGDGGFKFNLNHGKIFDNDFVIGPYSAYDKVLQQQMSVSDCMKFSN